MSDVASPPSPIDLAGDETPAENLDGGDDDHATTTGIELYGDRRDVVVVRVDGELWDLDREIPAGRRSSR